MNDFLKDALGFLLGCIAVSVVVFAFLGGWALIEHNGQAQSCASSDGHWIATDKPVSFPGDSGDVERSRECTR